MVQHPDKPDDKRKAEILSELRGARREKEKGYRAKALRMFPHVCARCGREFSGRRLRELTVHHRDHNFRNNPPDGSNWELLCLYCHDHEHEKDKMAGYGGISTSQPDTQGPALSNPFDALDGLVGDDG